MRYAQLVIGTAGSGKSTYCNLMRQHLIQMKRNAEVVNLDPTAEAFDYEPCVDVRELINTEDTMKNEQLNLGPNGSLVYCMDYLLDNVNWLEEKLGYREDDYILFDCPGQIELYTHLRTMTKLAEVLQKWNFRVCVVFLMDVQFLVEGTKFISGVMAILSVVMNMEMPHVSILSKMDLLNTVTCKKIESLLTPDSESLLETLRSEKVTAFNAKKLELAETVVEIINNFALVSFVPLNVHEEESLTNALITIDNFLGYGECEDIQTNDFE